MRDEDIEFNKTTSMYKGKQLRDMTREELMKACWELGELYTQELLDNKKD